MERLILVPPDPATVRSILVLRLRAFGDTLLTTPTLRGLKLAYPQAKLSILLEPSMAQVVAGLPYIDEVISYDRLGWKKKGKWAELKGTVGMWFAIRQRHFDLVVDVLGTPRTAMLAWMSGAPTRVGFGFRVRRWAYNLVWQPSSERKYIADYTADALRALGQQPDSLNLDFHVPTLAQSEMDAWLKAQDLSAGPKPLLVMAAGGWDLKRYPLEKMAMAVREILDASPRPALFLWGPGEEDMAKQLVALTGKDARLAPATDFQHMGALLKRSAVLLTNDNATKHLGVACGCPTVTIFGPTSDVAWHPPQDPKHLSVKLNLECMPCEALTCRLGTHECLQALEPVYVADAVLSLLQAAEC